MTVYIRRGVGVGVGVVVVVGVAVGVGVGVAWRGRSRRRHPPIRKALPAGVSGRPHCSDVSAHLVLMMLENHHSISLSGCLPGELLCAAD